MNRKTWAKQITLTQRVLDRSGYTELKAKHRRLTINRFPDLDTNKGLPPTSDMKGARGGSTAPVTRHQPPRGVLVGTLHKQGNMVLTKADLPYAGGKKV